MGKENPGNFWRGIILPDYFPGGGDTGIAEFSRFLATGYQNRAPSALGSPRRLLKQVFWNPPTTTAHPSSSLPSPPPATFLEIERSRPPPRADMYCRLPDSSRSRFAPSTPPTREGLCAAATLPPSDRRAADPTSRCVRPSSLRRRLITCPKFSILPLPLW